MKVNCLYHREQFLTNFCKDRHCLMPLCPQCISQHTQYHQQERTRPRYTTIYQTISQAHMLMSNCIEELQRDKKKNQNLMMNIQTMGDKVRQKIRGAKQLVRKAIDEAFIGLEKEINKQLEKYHEERSIYSLAKSERQEQVLAEYLDELNMMKSTLKSEKGISNIIYFYRQKHEEVDNFHSQFASYIQNNQSYHPKIELNNQAMHSIQSIISRIVKLGSHGGERKKKNQPLHDQVQNISPGTIRSSIQNKIKEKSNAQFIESQVDKYSPQKTSNIYSKQKNMGKLDGEYDKLTKRVQVLREENNKLSRLLIGDHKKL